MNTEFITDSRTETPKEKYERLVPLLIAGAGYDKNAENKIVREALADFLVGKTKSHAISAFEEYNATVARLKASAKEECGYTPSDVEAADTDAAQS